MAEYRKTSFGGQPAVELQGKNHSLVILPDSGGEIVSIRNLRTGYDCAFFKEGRAGNRSYAAPYEKSGAGFDELFPNIAGGVYPEGPWKGVPMPEKGEIWTLPQKTVTVKSTGEEGTALRNACGGVRFPYFFERTLILTDEGDGSRLSFFYRLKNRCGFPFRYQWSVQPHFNLHKGDRIEVPEGAEFVVDFSFNEDINDNSLRHKWPLAEGSGGAAVDFSDCGMSSGRGGEKLYLTGLAEKRVAVLSAEAGQKYTCEYADPGLDHCGIWIDRAVWPEGDPDTLIAVGPSNCLSDSFEESAAKGSLCELPPYGENRWSFSILIEPL